MDLAITAAGVIFSSMPKVPPEKRSKSLERYYRVRQKAEGRVPGGQGLRPGKIPDDERAGLEFLRKLDRHIELVDRRRITEEMRYKWHLRTMERLRRAKGMKPHSEALARRASRREERQHSANIREFICKTCANNRLFVPDVSDGARSRCRVCYRQKRLAYKARAKASGKWGVQARLRKHRRRALKKANGGAGHVSVADWQWVLDRYGSACLCCGSTAPATMDHVVPLAQGGPHDKSNLQPLCAMCNSIKQNTVADYRPDRPLAPMRRDPRNVRYVHGTD